MTFATDDLRLIHTRNYEVQAFARDASTMVLVGRVRDTLPAGAMIAGDPDPLDIHHMVVTLVISAPDLTITHAHVEFRVHPHTTCPAIVEHYGKLVGLSVARGFTHKVRELFGGPRGCTHTTALLQAMAPVVIQSAWGLRQQSPRVPPDRDRPMNDEHRQAILQTNTNTCHVWTEDGEAMARLVGEGTVETPVWLLRRLDELGRTAHDEQTA